MQSCHHSFTASKDIIYVVHQPESFSYTHDEPVQGELVLYLWAGYRTHTCTCNSTTVSTCTSTMAEMVSSNLLAKPVRKQRQHSTCSRSLRRRQCLAPREQQCASIVCVVAPPWDAALPIALCSGPAPISHSPFGLSAMLLQRGKACYRLP